MGGRGGSICGKGKVAEMLLKESKNKRRIRKKARDVRRKKSRELTAFSNCVHGILLNKCKY